MIMSARRCSRCSLNFPHATRWGRCPVCGEKTDSLADARPMSEQEARSVAAHAEHDRHYARREAERRRRGEPTPEELGAAEAREIIALNEALYGASE